VLRILMPVAMAGAVFVPLRSAMQELSWEVRVRTAIATLLRTSPEMRTVIRSSLKVDHHGVSLDVAIVGSAEDGTRLEGLLRERVRDVAGVEPSVAVLAVAGAVNIQKLESSYARATPMAAPHRRDIGEVRSSVGVALEQAWPDGELGSLLDWRLEVPAVGAPAVQVFHLGEPLGDSGVKLLASALAAKLDSPIGVRDVPYPPYAHTAESNAPGPWIPSLRAALDASRDHALFACVELASSFRADAGATSSTSAEIEVLLASARPDRLVVRRDAERWSVVLSPARCDDVADGGAEAAAPSRGRRARGDIDATTEGDAASEHDR